MLSLSPERQNASAPRICGRAPLYARDDMLDHSACQGRGHPDLDGLASSRQREVAKVVTREYLCGQRRVRTVAQTLEARETNDGIVRLAEERVHVLGKNLLCQPVQ